MGNFLVWVIWFLAAAGCLGSGLAVITFTNPFYSALALIANLGSLAVLFLLASAEFLAAAQVLVYAGAVMVMFLFVVAYLGGRADAPWAGGPRLLRGAAVVAAENTSDNRVSAGERYARIYEINLSRCIFCGYCELACPFDAITLGNEYELSEYSRDDLIYTKDMLLADPMKRVPVADPGLYDTPIPAYRSDS